MSSVSGSLVLKRDRGVMGGRVGCIEAGPEEGWGRAPEDKVPFPEVVLPVVVEGVGSPTFWGIVDRRWASANGGSAVIPLAFCGAVSSRGGVLW